MSPADTKRPIRIATRESQLALWQARHVAQLIRQVEPDRQVELVHVSTRGDRDRTEALSQLGGWGVFTREVQRVVLENDADLAVHSLKDLPTEPAAGLILAGIPERESRFDAFVLPQGRQGDLQLLPKGGRVGTGSPRRQAQLLRVRPDLQLLEIRGNIDTRLKKLDAGEYDAIVLAEAGLRRLGWEDRISARLAPPEVFPAVGQAALGLECREGDHDLRHLLQQISDPVARTEVLAERACLSALRAGCHAPVGVLSEVTGATVRLEAVVLSLDGQQRFHSESAGTLADALSVGENAAEMLIGQGAEAILSGA